MILRSLLMAVLVASPTGPAAAAATTAQQVTVQTVTVQRGAMHPAVSPDGMSIAVAILGKIWLVPISGGTARQLTFGIGWDEHPVWSYDQRYIAYVHHELIGSQIIIYDFETGGA